MGKSQGQFDMIEVSHCLMKAVLLIRMFLGLLDPDPDPLERGTNPAPYPAPDPSVIKRK
jgi:hypothetical protein